MTDQVENTEEMEADAAPEMIEGETKNEAFLRLVNKRLPVAVKRIRLIGNLTSPNYYYTPEQAEQVMAVLQAEFDKLRSQFDKTRDEVEAVPTIG